MWNILKTQEVHPVKGWFREYISRIRGLGLKVAQNESTTSAKLHLACYNLFLVIYRFSNKSILRSTSKQTNDQHKHRNRLHSLSTVYITRQPSLRRFASLKSKRDDTETCGASASWRRGLRLNGRLGRLVEEKPQKEVASCKKEDQDFLRALKVSYVSFPRLSRGPFTNLINKLLIHLLKHASSGQKTFSVPRPRPGESPNRGPRRRRSAKWEIFEAYSQHSFRTYSETIQICTMKSDC